MFLSARMVASMERVNQFGTMDKKGATAAAYSSNDGMMSSSNFEVTISSVTAAMRLEMSVRLFFGSLA